jgi:hypothetical protein
VQALAVLVVLAFRADETVHLLRELLNIHKRNTFALLLDIVPIKNGSPESGSRSGRVELNLIQTRQVYA